MYISIVQIFLVDEVCISHTKPVGDNKTVFTTQEVCKSAAHWFFPSKIFLKYNEVSATF